MEFSSRVLTVKERQNLIQEATPRPSGFLRTSFFYFGFLVVLPAFFGGITSLLFRLKGWDGDNGVWLGLLFGYAIAIFGFMNALKKEKRQREQLQATLKLDLENGQVKQILCDVKSAWAISGLENFCPGFLLDCGGTQLPLICDHALMQFQECFPSTKVLIEYFESSGMLIDLKPLGDPLDFSSDALPIGLISKDKTSAVQLIPFSCLGLDLQKGIRPHSTP